ncbi:tetratricopeptide repeat protein [Tamlana sp. 2201CG12-4]|uniref:tetratricopeptide repeat protein n=1 Tax=Tamlana sp. 2201CG12-4 TaxID=3112582 RepID=UPI002DBC838E|nr:tetratricopeptide repeat protein [Tamlana sp. 2201CG12-4]MEC3905532.1 tetratricopeptide repeat protein [Tamlana sp. 2201CG12-4]
MQTRVELSKNTSDKVTAMLALAEFQYEHNFSIAEQMANEVSLLIEAKKDSISQQQLAKFHIIKGVISRRKGKFPKALEYYLKAKEIYEAQDNLWQVSDVYHNMGMVYRSQKVHEKAVQFYKRSIDIKTPLKDTHGIAAGYNMMGVSYRKLKKLDSAVICYDKAKVLFQSINSIEDVQRVNNNMATLYSTQKKYDKALKLHQENIEQAIRQNRQYSLCTAYYNLASVYRKLGDYKDAMKAADSSLAIAKREGFKENIAKAYLRKSFIYSKLNDYKKAYEHYRIFNRHSDSIFNIENIKQIQALELNYEYAREKLADSLAFAQERREVVLIAEVERSKKWFYFILFIITIIGTVVIILLEKRNYKNKAQILTERVEKEKAKKKLLDEKVRANEEEAKRLIADNSMRLEFKQSLLDRLKNEIKPKAAGNIKQDINSLISELQLQITTESKLSIAQTKIEEVNKGFDAKLRKLYPSLTKTEREICALLRLNMTIKEIMTVRNTSLDSVKSTRYRIRKKIGLSSGQELEKFIQSIS